MVRSELYPPIDPYRKGLLRVDDLHTIYWEQSGSPDGVPVLFVHGGPGAGASPTHRRFFDPLHYRIIIFDQRGAGRSTPLGELRRNTTELLIADMERLRSLLGIERWHLFGGSWGSTLSLAYAQSHPERCLGLILRGIFLMRRREIDWFLYHMGLFFPEAWGKFSGFLPAAERVNLLEGYWRRLTADDGAIRLAAARSWSVFEGACSSLIQNTELIAAASEANHALGLARIEAHYFRNNVFEPETRLLDNVHRLRHIPAVIVHGRYDMICPVATADELHRAWPEADFKVIPDAGHSAMEPGTRAALVAATDRFRMVSGG